MSAVVAYLVIGLMVGALGAVLMRRRPGSAWAAPMMLGVVGALLGGFVGGVLLDVRYGQGLNLLGAVSAGLGSLVLVTTHRLVVRRTSAPGRTAAERVGSDAGS